MRVLDISQSRASRNLNILLDAGFLAVRRKGLWAYYSINDSEAGDSVSLFLQAIEQGLRNNKATLHDLELLKESKLGGQQLCD